MQVAFHKHTKYYAYYASGTHKNNPDIIKVSNPIQDHWANHRMDKSTSNGLAPRPARYRNQQLCHHKRQSQPACL